MSGAPTNQVIPREVVAQWEREADASMPSKGKGCNPTSWRAYCTAAYSTDVEPKLPRVAAISGAVTGGVCCLAVALLHLPFCCCAAPDGPAPNGPTHDGCRSCSLAFTQTVCCGWCCSYLLTLCSQIDGEQSYHDWLHRPYTEEELQPHREAYFAKKTAISSPERMAELERSLADAQAALPDGRKALTAKVEKLTT